MDHQISKFEDIIAWQKSRKFSLIIYKRFEDIKDFSFRDQIRRAAISISNNIAEGFERKSNRQFEAFLYIAKGSCGEVRSMLYNALDLKYINRMEFIEFYKFSIEISKLISGFIKSLR